MRAFKANRIELFGFLLPFFWYFGVAAQAIGFYVFGLLIPSMFFFRKKFSTELSAQLKFVGKILFGVWAIYVLSNVWNSSPWVKPGWSISAVIPKTAIPSKYLFRSQFSSALGVAGIWLFLFGCWKINHRGKSTEALAGDSKESNFCEKLETKKIMVSGLLNYRIAHGLVKGAACASILFGMYFLIQAIWGIDVRLKGWILPNQHRMSSGMFRIFGFYGHPLSMAGAALALTTLFCTLLIQSIFPRKKIVRSIFQDKQTWLPYLGVSAFFNVLFLWLSGGRTAIVCGCLIVGLFLATQFLDQNKQGKNCQDIEILTKQKKNIFLKNILIWMSCLGVSIGLAFVVYFRRVESLSLDSFLSSSDSNRLRFWQVYMQMIREKPIFGHGGGWLDFYQRLAYYDVSGFKNLSEKYNAHNIYLENLACIGILGSVFLGYGLYKLWCFLKVPHERVSSDVSTGLSQKLYVMLRRSFFWALSANALHGLTQNVFFDSNVFFVYLSVFFVLVWMKVNIVNASRKV